MTSNTDRIEKEVVLSAPLPRVWEAISRAEAFGTWFGMRLDGEFVAGRQVSGSITPTKVDAEVARMQEAYAGMRCVLLIERVEPMHLLSFRWHPYPVDEDAEFDAHPTTRVTFELGEVPEGTRLRITESGFDAIPVERRARAFADNSEGWEIQATLIGKYLERAA